MLSVRIFCASLRHIFHHGLVLLSSEKLALDKLLSSDPDACSLGKIYSLFTYVLFDKLVEIADSERFQQGHHRGAFKLVLVQLQRTVTFIDDIDDGESRI